MFQSKPNRKYREYIVQLRTHYCCDRGQKRCTLLSNLLKEHPNGKSSGGQRQKKCRALQELSLAKHSAQEDLGESLTTLDECGQYQNKLAKLTQKYDHASREATKQLYEHISSQYGKVDQVLPRMLKHH